MPNKELLVFEQLDELLSYCAELTVRPMYVKEIDYKAAAKRIGVTQLRVMHLLDELEEMNHIVYIPTNEDVHPSNFYVTILGWQAYEALEYGL